MPKTPPRSSRNALLIAIPVLVILIPLGYSLVSPLFARDAGDDQAFLERPDPKYENCVEETTYMRFHHWELLKEIREEVVRYGVRREVPEEVARYGIRGKLGLKTCTECHTSRERFCNQCHDAVSLYPDCFDCHHYP